MKTITFDTHKAIVSLQEAGVDLKQAEAIVNLFVEVFGNETDSRKVLDVNKTANNKSQDDVILRLSLHEEIKTKLTEINNNVDMIKKIIFTVGWVVGLPVTFAALKYIFLS